MDTVSESDCFLFFAVDNVTVNQYVTSSTQEDYRGRGSDHVRRITKQFGWDMGSFCKTYYPMIFSFRYVTFIKHQKELR